MSSYTHGQRRDEQPVPAPLITADELYRDLAGLVTKRRAEFVDLAVEVTEGLNVVLRHLNDALRELGDHVQAHTDEAGERLDGRVGGANPIGVHEELLPLPGDGTDLVERLSKRVEQFLSIHSVSPSVASTAEESVGGAAAAGEGSAAAATTPSSPRGDFVSFRPRGAGTAAGDPPSPTGVTGSHTTTTGVQQ